MKKYLLDTNSIIYALNGGLLLPKAKYIISIITEIELLSFSKLTKEEIIFLKKALSNFESIELSSTVKDETIEIRRSSSLKLPDSIILATAKAENAILITSDKQLLGSKIVEAIELHEL